MALFRPEISNFLGNNAAITSKIPDSWTKNHSFLAQTAKSKQLHINGTFGINVGWYIRLILGKKRTAP
jgi:hypothetical protein